jgi:hypothetical protein
MQPGIAENCALDVIERFSVQQGPGAADGEKIGASLAPVPWLHLRLRPAMLAARSTFSD